MMAQIPSRVEIDLSITCVSLVSCVCDEGLSKARLYQVYISLPQLNREAVKGFKSSSSERLGDSLELKGVMLPLFISTEGIDGGDVKG